LMAAYLPFHRRSDTFTLLLSGSSVPQKLEG
jgi:hypothetical protein